MGDVPASLALVALIFIATKYVTDNFPTLPKWAGWPVAIVVSIGLTFLVGASAFAHDTIVSEKNLGDASGPTKLVVALILSAPAGFAHQVGKWVQNIGDNKTADEVDATDATRTIGPQG